MKVWLAERPLLVAVLAAFGLWIIVRVLERALWVVALVIVALILAATISPIVALIRSVRLPPRGWRIPKAVAVVLVYLALAIALGLGGYLVGRSIVGDLTAFLAALPTLAAQVLEQLARFAEGMGVPELAPSPEAIVALVQRWTVEDFGALGVTGVLVNLVFEFLFQLFLLLTLVVFLVTESDRIVGFWVSLFPPSQREAVLRLTTHSGDQVGRWALGQLAVATITGTTAGLISLLLGLPYPALIGIVTALLDLAPVLGPGLMVFPVFFLGLSQSLLVAVAGVAAFLALSQFDGNVLSPLITGRAVRLSPVLVLIAIPFGLALYGPIGAVVAIPATASLQVVVTEVLLPWLRERHVVPGEAKQGAENRGGTG